jgi:ribosomal protein L21
MAFTVIETGGKQYKVADGNVAAAAEAYEYIKNELLELSHA